MDTVQSRKDGQCTKIATVVPGNKDKRREDTKIEGPGSRRPRRPSCKDGTRTLDRSMSFKTGVRTGREGAAILIAGQGPQGMKAKPAEQGGERW